MDPKAFEKIRELVYRESGIALKPEKVPLVQNRLSKRLRALKMTSPEEYLQFLQAADNNEEITQLIDAISTNTTHFFREEAHFTLLKQLLEEWEDTGKEMKIWCAASSSGEEPYTLALTAAEALEPRNIPFRILATDICTDVLRKAEQGIYEAKKLQQIPKQLLRKHFSPCNGPRDKNSFQVKNSLKRYIIYRKLNLAHFPLPLQGPIDIIFCRNVMIYFDSSLRAKLAIAFQDLLPSGGYLFIGHSENLLGAKHQMKSVQPAVYRK